MGYPQLNKMLNWQGLCPPIKLFIMVICLQLVMAAQGNAQQGKWIREGETYLNQGNYLKALECFRFAAKKDTSWKPLEGIARCYLPLRKYNEAEKYYGLAARKADAPAELYFAYGRVLMTARKYEQAQWWIEQFRTKKPNDPRGERFRNLKEKMKWLMTPVKGTSVSSISVNTKASEFAPMIWEQGIIFASNRANDLAVVRNSAGDAMPLADLYQTVKKKGKWTRVTPLKGTINSARNEGPATKSKDSTYILITREYVLPRKNEKGRISTLGLFRVGFQNNKWTIEKPLSLNKPDYAVAHPALSSDGNTLIFSSDMPGGYGGMDLYRVTKNGDEWGKPKNLGPMINTEGNEVFPFIFDDREIYFASDGHLGIGGLDLFAVSLQNTGNQPRNLGYPINSPRDDFGLVWDTTGLKGYFTSNRNGNDDILELGAAPPTFTCQAQEENYYCYRFYDAGFIETDTLKFVYQWDMGDGTKLDGLEVEHCFPGPGEYKVRLNLVDSTTGTVYMIQSEYDFEIEDIEQVVIEMPDSVEAGETFQISGENTNLPECSINQYLWDLGEGFVVRGQKQSISFSEPGIKRVSLAITGKDGQCESCSYREIKVIKPERKKKK